MDIISFARAITKLRDRISEYSLEIVVDQDQHNYASYIQHTEEAPGEHFGVSFNTITPENLSCVYLREKIATGQYKTVGTCVARLDNLGEWSLSDYWKVHMQRIFTHEDGGRPELKDKQPGFARKRPGRVIYMGAMWIDKEWRGHGLAQDLAHLAMMINWLTWKPNLIYAFMTDDHVSRGLASKFEWGMIKPMGIRWERRATEFPHDLWYVANDQEDVEDLAYRHAQ
ncbi:hypothetical protein GCM10007094_22920 [Pseudovibrio japonicus]|uniref:N-acetyltransferase domain-containing protein n=1 Tax=Pseudovibrio japonicus TaxID=366534 RepID=A0ABQ3ECR3_9HYPH|nr:hypothetical protein [Pseudovibrio japonicus]GHB33591.1 hypothetical protein GCM10007094_22920 [Pseudovibrio japonicus]